MERAAAYYRDRLGFTCETYGEPPNFASAQRDGSSILLAPEHFEKLLAS